VLITIEYVRKYATKEAADAATNPNEESEDEEMSSVGSYEDEEPAGELDL